MIASILANTNRAKDTDPVKQPSDFFHSLKPKAKPQTTADHAVIVRRLAAIFGGEITITDTRGAA